MSEKHDVDVDTKQTLRTLSANIIMDDDATLLLRLQELQQKNSDRWNILRELHHEYLLEVEERRQQQERYYHEESASEVISPSILLECELQQLQAMTPPTTQFPLLTSRDFGLELIETFQQHADAQAVLEHHIELEKMKMQRLIQSLTQQKQIWTALNSIKSDQQSLLADREEGDVGEEHQSPMEENKWLRQELLYVSERIESYYHKKPKRQQQHENIGENDDDHDEIKTNDNTSSEAGKKRCWSLDKLLLELIHQNLNSPSEPYILADPNISSINPRHVELLQSCCVIQRHDDNPYLIRITEYDYNSSDER